MKVFLKRLTACFATGLLMTASVALADTDVDININVGPPPPVVIGAPPTMLFLGEPGVYVAVGIGYDIFFLNGRYYYFHSGNWFWAPGYGGPWIFVRIETLPPGLRKFKIKDLHLFRDREFKVYKTQGPKYKGRHFVGAPGSPAKPHGPAKGGPHLKEGKGAGKGRGK